MLVRITLATVLSAPALLLTACGGGTSSVADPPVSSVTSATPNPPKRETPEHFIRRWAAESTRMQETGETAEFRSMSRGCVDCLTLAHRIEGIYKSGGYVRTKGWVVLSIEVRPKAQNRLVTLRVRSRPTRYRASADAPEASYPGGPETYRVMLVPAGLQSWLVTSLGRIAT